MNKFIRIGAAAILLSLFLPAGAALATAIKSWTTGETVRASDLNANFTHLHNTTVGTHGTRLVNADVSTTAAIAHSKLATPAVVPKAFALVGMPAGVSTPCAGAAAAGTACTINTSSRVTSVLSHGTNGTYRVILSYTPANALFSPLVTSHTASIYCNALGTFTITGTSAVPHFFVECRTDANVLTDAAFSFLVMDNDN
jgi:hypothetical protein